MSLVLVLTESSGARADQLQHRRLGSNEEAKGLLRWYWYTGKDQSKPLNAIKKERNCHIKVSLERLSFWRAIRR